MHNRSDGILQMPRIHYCKFMLHVAWLAGLILGIAFSYCTQIFSSLMRGALGASVSIVGLGTVLYLPYLLTAFAVWVHRPSLLILVAFLKSFFYGACAAALDLSFSGAGWLIRLFLLFSDSASIPVLFWLWNRCLESIGQNNNRDFLYSGGVLLLIGIIDYLVIAPFLALMI